MAELAVQLKKVINAPIEKVFKAWIEPEQMKQWYSPEGMSTPAATSEARAGGQYTVTMKMGDKTFDMSGKYLEFDEPNRLVFSWNHDDSVVTVDFKKLADDKTEVSLKHTGFANEQSRAQHDDGWVGTLDKLAKHFR